MAIEEKDGDRATEGKCGPMLLPGFCGSGEIECEGDSSTTLAGAEKVCN